MTLDRIVLKTVYPAFWDKLMGIVVIEIFYEEWDLFFHCKYLQFIRTCDVLII